MLTWKYPRHIAKLKIKVHSCSQSIFQFPQQQVYVGVFACACLYLTYFQKNTQEAAPSGEWDWGLKWEGKSHFIVYPFAPFIMCMCYFYNNNNLKASTFVVS